MRVGTQCGKGDQSSRRLKRSVGVEQAGQGEPLRAGEGNGGAEGTHPVNAVNGVKLPSFAGSLTP